MPSPASVPCRFADAVPRLAVTSLSRQVPDDAWSRRGWSMAGRWLESAENSRDWIVSNDAGKFRKTAGCCAWIGAAGLRGRANPWATAVGFTRAESQELI